MARTAAATARLESILFSALNYLGKKRVRKEHQVAGTRTQVTGTITARVERSEVTIDFDGNLIVGEEQTVAKSAAADAAQVAAWLLDQFDEATRDRILATLPVKFEELDALPQVPKKRLTEAKDLLTRLRGSKMATKSGAVVFQLVGDDEDEDESDEVEE